MSEGATRPIKSAQVPHAIIEDGDTEIVNGDSSSLILLNRVALGELAG